MCEQRTSHVQLRYANNSQYKNDTMIRKEVYCNPVVLEELKRIITDSEVRTDVCLVFQGAGCGLHGGQIVRYPRQRKVSV